jgi:hypothetical protein
MGEEASDGTLQLGNAGETAAANGLLSTPNYFVMFSNDPECPSFNDLFFSRPAIRHRAIRLRVTTGAGCSNIRPW